VRWRGDACLLVGGVTVLVVFASNFVDLAFLAVGRGGGSSASPSVLGDLFPSKSHRSNATASTRDVEEACDRNRPLPLRLARCSGEDSSPIEAAVASRKDGEGEKEQLQQHSSEESFLSFSPTARYGYRGSLDDLPLPVEVVERYKGWHSVAALRSDPERENRSFLVGYYYCPFRAGNILHGFLNRESHSVSIWRVNCKELIFSQPRIIFALRRFFCLFHYQICCWPSC